MKHIFRCNNCSRYTMNESCECGNKAMLARLMKYTPDDRFSSYRRKAKLGEYTKRGLL